VDKVRVGVIGCGSIARYCHLPEYTANKNAEVVAICDINEEHLETARKYVNDDCRLYTDSDKMIEDPDVEAILIATPNHTHRQMAEKAFSLGKHVFTEKPMTMTFSEAQVLVELANAKGLYFSSAPCGVLGETAQTLWRALNNREIGKVLAVYAEIDEGPIQLRQPHLWRSASGAPYPYRDEFEVGCVLEHTGY
jgi:predicted dehydrogenase